MVGIGNPAKAVTLKIHVSRRQETQVATRQRMMGSLNLAEKE